MFKNYLTIAFRNFWKNKVFSLINIAGLAIGISASLVICLISIFAYRTPISWWIFAASGLGMLVIALFTLSIQTVRSAIANPVKSLRTE